MRHAHILQLQRHLIQLMLRLVPTPTLVHTNKDVLFSKKLGELYHGGAPMIPYHALVIEVHASDIDALGGLRELRSRRVVGIEKVPVDSKNVEYVYKDYENQDDLGEARAEEATEVEAVCMRDHDCLCAVMRTAKQHHKDLRMQNRNMYKNTVWYFLSYEKTQCYLRRKIIVELADIV